MARIPHRYGTHRHRILWCVLALLLLLYQQAAFAAGVCAVSVPSVAATATAVSQPASMSRMPGYAGRLLCAQHCAQGTPIPSDARLLHTPRPVFLPLAPAAPAIAILPRAAVSLALADQGFVYRRPLRLLFCSFLI